MVKKNIKMMKRYLVFLLALTTGFVFAQSPNTLSKEEKKEGWKLLFDGKSTKGWRNYNSDKIGSAWKVSDGALFLDTSGKTNGKMVGGGDVVTVGQYENYELSLEWKIQACGNSGVMFNVQESASNSTPWKTGPEMQVLDNSCHPDAKIIKHRAGDLYDLISCSTETAKPVGEWNVAKIVTKNGHYEFWLNGVKNVEFDMHTADWDRMVAASKFKDMPEFGKHKKGHISLQDHGDQVWFRNIKIKELK
jgi:3-keto-disaccharide hydrolase